MYFVMCFLLVLIIICCLMWFWVFYFLEVGIVDWYKFLVGVFFYSILFMVLVFYRINEVDGWMYSVILIVIVSNVFVVLDLVNGIIGV